MVVHESVDPKAQGKPDLGTGVTNQVSVVSVSVGTRRGLTRESVCGRERAEVCGYGVCEVVVGDARVAVANGGNDGEGREPLSVALSVCLPRRVLHSNPAAPRARALFFPPRVPGRPALIVPLNCRHHGAD